MGFGRQVGIENPIISRSDAIKSGKIRSSQARSDQVMSGQVKSGQTLRNGEKIPWTLGGEGFTRQGKMGPSPGPWKLAGARR